MQVSFELTLKEGRIRVEERASQMEGVAWAKVWRWESKKHMEGSARDMTINKMH